jgi:diguanylate cyclase (GGDEF)-like protein
MGLEWDHRNVHFDLVSSLISTGALAAMMGIWMLLASRVRDEPNAPELRIWGFSCLLFGVAYVLFSARGSIDLVLSMVLGNVLFAVAYCGFGWAIARLFRRPYPFAVVGISVTAASLALYVTEIVIATTQWRTLVLVVITIVPWIVSYLQCSRHWRAQRLPSVMAMRIFFAAVILVSVTRTAASVISGSFGYEGLPTGPGFLLGTFILLISPILLTVGFFVLCAEQAQEVIRQMANTDALTGILNRRSVLAEAERRLATARRHGRELACVIFDLDRFKTVNDRFGHAAGDLAIVGVARTLTPMTRAEDVFGRLGGDEFVLFLPDAGIDGACRLAERFCAAIASASSTSQGGEIKITASFGVATLTAEDDSPPDILKRADRAMYAAKAAGGNAVRAAVGDDNTTDAVQAPTPIGVAPS